MRGSCPRTIKCALYLEGIQLLQVEEASYKKYGGFDGVQEARRQQLDLQAASRLKRKAVEAKKVMSGNNIQDTFCDAPFMQDYVSLLVLSNVAYQFTKWLVHLWLASVKLLTLHHIRTWYAAVRQHKVVSC